MTEPIRAFEFNDLPEAKAELMRLCKLANELGVNVRACPTIDALVLAIGTAQRSRE